MFICGSVCLMVPSQSFCELAVEPQGGHFPTQLRAVGEGWSGKGWEMSMTRSQQQSLDLPETAPSSASQPRAILPGATAEGVGMLPSCLLKPSTG